MNQQFTFTLRDVVNLFCWHIPAVLGWACILYGVATISNRRKP